MTSSSPCGHTPSPGREAPRDEGPRSAHRWAFGLCRPPLAGGSVGDMDEFEDVRRLTVDACWALLRAADIGRLAVVVGDRPEIFPVNFVVDHGTVVIRTAPGTKLAAA